MKEIVNFLFEVGILAKTPRSFHSFLGHGNQSVAEHINRVVFVGYVLSFLEKDVDADKVMKMCLFHDLTEARISDLNYVHQKYVKSDEGKAVDDLTESLPFGNEIKRIIHEYEERKTKEAIIAKDADTIEFILSLKEQIDIGNTRADTWMKNTIKRLKTESAKQLVMEILYTKSDEWWFSNKDDNWWINRNKETRED